MFKTLLILILVLGFIHAIDHIYYQCIVKPFVNKYHIEQPALIDCSHPRKTDVVVNVNTVCEDVWTICGVCNEVLNKRTDC